MSSDSAPWIDALAASHDHLGRVVATLAPDQLRAPSACADWDISQVLSHLGSGAEIHLAGVRAVLAGDDPPSGDLNQPIWDRWNAWSPEERAAGFLATDEALVATYVSMDDGTRQTFRLPLSFTPAPVDLVTAVSMRLSEHALHSWDVYSALEPGATVDARSTELLVDRPSPFFSYLANGGWSGDAGALEIRTTSPERRFTLAVGESTSLTEGAPAAPIGVVTLPAEAWLRLVMGRMAPEQTPPGVESDPADLVDRLRTLFGGI